MDYYVSMLLTLCAVFLSSCSAPSSDFNAFEVQASQDPLLVYDPSQVSVEMKGSNGFSFRWPLAEVRLTSHFGGRGEEFHPGLDLHAKPGTPVFAAQAGKVVYAGSRMRGYGKMIMIEHSSGITTLYAHNSRLLVKKGQWVRQGQRIASSGRTGRVTAPHLHFEVRSGEIAIDPLKYLSQSPRSEAGGSS
jgi:murein DD-endopeptidase MepM/ murein hydrolase activator NlpD